MQLWNHIAQNRRELEFARNPRLEITWKVYESKRTLFGIADELDSLGLEREAKKVEDFLSEFDSMLQDDPEDAIQSASSLVDSLRPVFAEKHSEIHPLPVSRGSTFFPNIVNCLFHLLDDNNHLPLVCSIVEFLTELLTQPATRRYLTVFLENRHVLPHLRISPCIADASLRDLTDMFAHYLHFPIDDLSGVALTPSEASSRFSEKIAVLQNIVFK